MLLFSFFLGVFAVSVYFVLNIWHATLAGFDGVTTEQFTKFMTMGEVLSCKIQKIISDFCFHMKTKWRVKPNNISFFISFVVANIFVLRVRLQSLPRAEFF